MMPCCPAWWTRMCTSMSLAGTEWEGFETATRAAAAGGYTLLLDMPLNCLPETTTVAALNLKRAAARGKCWVDWAPWGGCVNGNQAHLRPLAQAGVPGFKCFLIYPGCDGFTEIDAAHLEQALPTLAELGLPLLVHAELAGPIDAARASLDGADWRRLSNLPGVATRRGRARSHRASAPAVPYISLSVTYRSPVHRTGAPSATCGQGRGPAAHGRNLPALPHLCR